MANMIVLQGPLSVSTDNVTVSAGKGLIAMPIRNRVFHKRPIRLAVVMCAYSLISISAATAAELTMDVSHYEYEELHPSTNAFFMEDISDPGFFSIGLRSWNRPDADGGFGLLYTVETTYGQTAYSGSGTMTKDYYKQRFEGYLAYRANDALSPFLGLAYRRLLDDSGGTLTSTGASGYDRLSEYFYVPIGVRFDVNDLLYIKAQYNLFVEGTQTSYVYGTVENKQTYGWGADLTVNYRVNESWSIYSFYRYWDIDNSTIDLSGDGTHTGQEPQNTTSEVGLGISVKF